MAEKKQILKNLIQKSAILPKTDKDILLKRLDNFSDKKIKKLSGLLQSEQEKITNFGTQLKENYTEYRHTLEKDKQTLRSKVEQHEAQSAEKSIDEALKQL